MPDCSIPTKPVDTKIVAADAYKHYKDVVGAASDPADSSVVGQRVLCAYQRAYWEILNALRAKGISLDCITDLYWQTIDAVDHDGPLRTWLRYCAAYYWLSDTGVSRSTQVFQDAERYHLICKRLLEGHSGDPLTKPDGTTVDLDGSTGPAAQNQGEYSYRENSAGNQNDWRIQSTPQQFLAGSASTRVAGAKYGNKHDGSS